VSAEAVPAASPALPPRRIGVLIALALVVIAIDQVSKILVVANFVPGDPHRLLGGLVYLTLTRNPGAAFGIGEGMTWILTLIVILVIVAIIRYASRLRSIPWAICLGLILGGAIGNLIDRLLRSPGFLRGHVVDFVSLFEPYGEHFAIFNLADSGITVGGVILVITALLGIEIDGRRRSSAGTGKADADA
jgi:signal peptidase II